MPLRPRRGLGPTASLAIASIVAIACSLPSRAARAETGVSGAIGFSLNTLAPDGEQRRQLGVPWFLRAEVLGISRLDSARDGGERPRRGHFAVHDGFFFEVGLGAVCSKQSCASLGDVHLRGLGGYEALVGWRAPDASVYVGPRISWEGWVTAKYAVGAASWPVVVRFDHAVARTRRRVFSAWGSPHGAFPSYGAQWDEPLGDSVWLTTWGSGTRAIAAPWRSDDGPSVGALGVTIALGVRVGPPL